MKSIRFAVVAALVLGVCGLSLLDDSASAKITKGNSRPAATKYLMRGIVKTHCGAIGKALKAGPADDEAWDTLACHAACLSEMGHVLMADGRCPDGVWASASKSLQSGTAGLIEAIGNKDLDAANAAFKTATSSCGACHKAHKK